MFIDQFLSSIAVNNDRKVIKSPNLSANLKSIEQINDNGLLFGTHFVQEAILEIECLSV